MRTTRLAAAIVLIAAGNMSFNAAAQSAPSAKDIAEMKAQIAALQAQIQSLEDRSQDLEARSDAQSDVNVEQAKANESLATIDSLKKLVNDTKLSGRLYYDLTNINDSSKGVKTDKSGFAFDIKRFYLGVDHKFNDQWSMNLTTDFQYSSAISSTEVYLKKAYIQYKLSDAFVLRAGAADLNRHGERAAHGPGRQPCGAVACGHHLVQYGGWRVAGPCGRGGAASHSDAA